VATGREPAVAEAGGGASPVGLVLGGPQNTTEISEGFIRLEFKKSGPYSQHFIFFVTKE
jgi:hypothetical protein